MTRLPILWLSALVIAGAFAMAPTSSAYAQPLSASCEVGSMRAVAPAGATILSAEGLQSPVRHCRVEGYVTTTNPGPNRVNFRLQLPDRDLSPSAA